MQVDILISGKVIDEYICSFKTSNDNFNLVRNVISDYISQTMTFDEEKNIFTIEVNIIKEGN